MGDLKGIILSGSNNVFDVEVEGGIRRCSLKGKKLSGVERFYNPLAPGDLVEVEGSQIASLCGRRNAFTRWNEKGRSVQVLAANVDRAGIVTTPGEPAFRPRFVDRVLVQAAGCGVEPLIVVNKADLPIDEAAEERLNAWEKAGYPVLRVSAMTGSGLAALSRALAGKLTVLVGQSGVGKSSLINAFAAAGKGNAQLQRTGTLSEKYGKGSHTTTRGVLLRISGDGGAFSVIDTPGVRNFVVHDLAGRDLAQYFPEIAPLALTCQFGASCSHTGERGCAVLRGVEQGAVHPDRYESLLRIKGV